MQAKELIQKIKKIPLFDICVRELGYQIYKKKDCQSWRCLKDSGGAVLLVKSTPDSNGYYFCYDVDEGRKKDLINLLKDRGYTFKRIREEFGDVEYDYEKYKAPPFWQENQEQEDNTATVLNVLKKHREGNNVPYVENVLIRRGISSDTLRFFGVPLYKKSALFSLYYLKQNTQQFGLQSAIFYTWWQGKTKKLFLKGLKRGGSFSLLRRGNALRVNSKTALFFESPLDALSYFELFKEEEALYFSTCGTLTYGLKKSIRNILKLFGIKNIKICMDNDQAGKKITGQLREILNIKEFKYQEQYPQKGDWNDELKQQNYAKI